ncbi:hypothetical protein [Massilia sp. METH4]|uniref:hypothetical protein n=1 Tax=Massilia sp. METH4 TaxID=3123041 RepID=UPI0030D2428D
MNEETVMEESSSASYCGSANGTERRFAAVEREVAVIGSNYATKEDLVKLESRVQDRLSRIENTMSLIENRLIRWYFGTSVALVALVFSIGKLM